MNMTDEIFQKRHSVRNFLAKAVEPEKLQEILEAANSAPSAGNLKAREIVVVKNQNIKEKLALAAFEQDFVAQAPIILVFFSVSSRSAKKYGERGKNLYALQDATLAAAFAWLQAVKLGLGACWVGAFADDEVKEILKISKEWQPIAILPLGYSAE